MGWDERRLGRRLKLRDLNVLMTVARCGSMGKAAAQLGVSQPAISRTIVDMEHTLGVRLLDRSSQGVEPTIYARVLLDRGVIAFDELRQAMEHIEFLVDPTAGELRIGASIVNSVGIVAAVLDRLSRQYPRIVFHLLAAETGIVYRALEDRKVDLIVATIFVPIAEERMHPELLYDEPHVVVAGPGNPWLRRRRVALDELINEPWTLPPPDSSTGSVVHEAFQSSGLAVPRTTIITSNTPVRNALLSTGRFLTIAPQSVLTFPANNAALKRLPIDLPTTRRAVGIIRLKHRTLSPVAQLFMDCARELTKPLAKAR